MSQEDQKAEVEIVENDDDLPTPAEVLPEPEHQGNLIPQMNVSLQPVDPNEVKKCPVSDEKLLGFYEEIHTDIDKDRAEIDDLLTSFKNMVINEGDSTTASKEALVKLVELKLGTADKKAKIADLMTRLKLKDTYAYSGPHMNAIQQNNVTIETRRDMIKDFQSMAKKKKGK